MTTARHIKGHPLPNCPILGAGRQGCRAAAGAEGGAPHAVRRRRRPGHVRGPGGARQPDPGWQGHHGRGGIVALVLGLFFGVGPDQLGLSSGDPDTTAIASSAAQVQQSCLTGEDANTKDDCRTVAVVNSVQNYWGQEFALNGERYTPARTVLFSDRIATLLRVGHLGGRAALLPG
ncbi:neutral zinc metallopeptidase [Streptomyces sp. NBC_00887]|uniref:neutral zinc metallopeptidase n=1 Tax=Streptomyces sp. NBC_00887 TaxID=2975859 RepID=UPI00386F963C|nr:neutral zinc metallopeptidase [Streptomyces sp. NBC_00887]WSY34975.1 neutral zinc metallopeptidase [Streptomyces sp. NBC_00887]